MEPIKPSAEEIMKDYVRILRKAGYSVREPEPHYGNCDCQDCKKYRGGCFGSQHW